MSARKLQQEFDKLNKKINEGLAAFYDIKEKIQHAEVASQRDKFENDLKKELKKLQRSRDQLKIWLGDSSIKLDKNAIQENRTKIEHAMDTFKELEKISKIKQFSNEGLEIEKQRKHSRFGEVQKLTDACDYVSSVIEQLNTQNEELEQDLESIGGQSKKKGSSAQQSIDDIKYKIDRNNTHIEKLEVVLENLENDLLDPAKIDDVKDDLDYYVEMNQDEEYVEYDDFYDQLEPIEEEEEEVEGSLAQMAAESFEEEERKRLELQQLGQQQSEATRATQSASAVTSSNVPSTTSAQPAAPRRAGSVSDSTKSISNNTPSHVGNGPVSSTTPVKKLKQHNVVPAPPPPITSANSYSNVIKAAQANNINNGHATSSNTQHSSNNTPTMNNNVPLATALASAVSSAPTASTSNSTTPAKSLPPGFNHIASSNITKSTSTSPLITQSKLHEETQQLKKNVSNNSNISQSPSITSVSTTTDPLSDSLNKLLNITNSRLNDPLPIQSISSLLETSLLNCPDSFDAEKPRQYSPSNVHPSSIDYPQEPMFELNSSHYMSKFDDDLLFFCFYYSEGIDNFAKYNSSKELIKRGWIFNIEKNQWLSTKENSKTKNIDQSKENSSNGNINEKENDGSNSNDDKFKRYFDENSWLIRNYV
ncbi:NOT5 [Candida pseudojiufengensis]|uniref:NOT5 n=1 Tax=Candida pseudojiufengensis TaxID=497109 RepID=UPI0022254707|nr:NOT5 [Candida pseudojiufengensis]KAI5963648.1 NOT5 [Candida pseudojiufengensis]